MSIKWNWGTGIVLAFVLFCSFILYIVVRGFQENIDLVSDTYYLDELAYQERITEHSNLHHSGLEVALSQTSSEVKLQFPEGFSDAVGEVYFYHPSREIFDRHYPISLDGQRAQLIPKEDLIKGHFKVKIQWVVNDTPYFQEAQIFLR